MNARAIIEANVKDELLPAFWRGEVSAWRDALYELGFNPNDFDFGQDESFREKFPMKFNRNWQGHDLNIEHNYLGRTWKLSIDGTPTGHIWKEFDPFLGYLNEHVLVAKFKR